MIKWGGGALESYDSSYASDLLTPKSEEVEPEISDYMASSYPGIEFVVAPEGYSPVTEWVNRYYRNYNLPTCEIYGIIDNPNGTETETVRFFLFGGKTNLAGYLLQIIDHVGNVCTIDLSNVPIDPNGAITITILRECGFRVLEPVS